MNEWIRLANRQKLNNTYIVGLDDEHITVHASGITTMQEAFTLFGDPQKTKRIHSNQYGDEADWVGFTVPTGILIENGGAVVNLAKEVVQDG